MNYLNKKPDKLSDVKILVKILEDLTGEIATTPAGSGRLLRV
jgi:hypothetical protein